VRESAEVRRERERIVDLLEVVDRALARADRVRLLAYGLQRDRLALVVRLGQICRGRIR
jgi:hypothetical protein